MTDKSDRVTPSKQLRYEAYINFKKQIFYSPDLHFKFSAFIMNYLSWKRDM